MTGSAIRFFISILLLVPASCLVIDKSFAQTLDTSSPRKFDELTIDYYKANGGSAMDNEARLLRFAKQLRREPSTQAFVIAYSPRVRNRRGSDYWSLAPNRLLTTKAQLSNYGIPESRIIGVNGGIREKTQVELWILPRGAKPPQPRPEFTEADVIECCVLNVTGELYQYRTTEPLTFKAQSSLGTCPQITGYNWSTSSGKIISGQGTNTIQVDASSVTARLVKATVAAEGMAGECISEGSVATVIGVMPHKLVEFEWFSEDVQIWGDYLTHFLTKEPDLRGHIIVYAGRNGDLAHAQARADRARDYLVNARGLLPDRFSIVEGGYREKEMFEYWLVPAGSIPPAPSPTVDKKYVRLNSRLKPSQRRR